MIIRTNVLLNVLCIAIIAINIRIERKRRYTEKYLGIGSSKDILTLQNIAGVKWHS